MVKITISGFLFMKAGHSQWIKRYVVLAGLSIAWFHRKSQFKHKAQPMGAIALTQCKIDSNSILNQFTISKQQSNNTHTTFSFKANQRKICRRWIKQLKFVIEECKLIQSKPMDTNQAQAFGLYRNSLQFFTALQSRLITVADYDSDIDKESGSISSVSNPDTELPIFYGKLNKRRNTMRKYYILWKGFTKQQRSAGAMTQQTSTSTKTVTNTVTQTHDRPTRTSTTLTRRSSMTLKRVEEIDVSIDAESSEEIALIRNTMVGIDMDLQQIDFNEKHLSIQEKNVIRYSRLFYSCGNESMAVYVQLYENVMQYFEDEECMEEIGQIDFRSITGIKYIDEDTFELHTVIHDKVHVFAMYDTKCHQARLWVDDIVRYGKITRIEVSMDESMDYDDSTDDSKRDTIKPVLVHDIPWYWYLCCCCLCNKKPEVVIYPTMDNVASDYK